MDKSKVALGIRTREKVGQPCTRSSKIYNKSPTLMGSIAWGKLIFFYFPISYLSPLAKILSAGNENFLPFPCDEQNYYNNTIKNIQHAQSARLT